MQHFVSPQAFSNTDTATTRSQTTYINVPYKSDVIFHSEDFLCVDVHSHKKGLTVLGTFPPPFTSRTTTPPNSLNEYFQHSLHSSLQDICGRVLFPPRQRVQINKIYQRVDSKENFCNKRCFPKKWSINSCMGSLHWANIRSLAICTLGARDLSKVTRNTSPLVEANCKESQKLLLSPTLSQTSFLHLARYTLSVIILGLFSEMSKTTFPSIENQTETYT